MFWPLDTEDRAQTAVDVLDTEDHAQTAVDVLDTEDHAQTAVDVLASGYRGSCTDSC